MDGPLANEEYDAYCCKEQFINYSYLELWGK